MAEYRRRLETVTAVQVPEMPESALRLAMNRGFHFEWAPHAGFKLVLQGLIAWPGNWIVEGDSSRVLTSEEFSARFESSPSTTPTR